MANNQHVAVSITKPTLEDIPRLLSLWEKQYRYHHELDSDYYVPNSKELNHKFEEYLTNAINNDEPCILIAKEKTKIVGFITFEKNTEFYFDTKIQNFGEIIELFVEEKYRKKGIGTDLVRAVEKICRQKGLSYLKVGSSSFNRAAINFYQQNGYYNSQTLLFKKI